MDVFTQFTPELNTIWDDIVKKDGREIPFFTFSWHKTVSELIHPTWKPYIFVEKDASVIVPLAIDGTTVRFGGGEEIADYLDAIGPKEHQKTVWGTVLSLLSSTGIPVLHLRNIPEESETHQFFLETDPSALSKEDTTPILSLPATVEEYHAALARKDRHELKRKMKKFENEHPDLIITDNETDITSLLTLMRKHEVKNTFLTPQMTALFTVLPTLFAPGFRQFRLMEHNTCIATTITFRTHNDICLYNTGYDPTIVGAGFYMNAAIITWAINNRIRRINFLQGNERYKYELGAYDSFVYTVSRTFS